MGTLIVNQHLNFDVDATAYIAAVESADGQTLESKTRRAIDDFVRGCKADGIWDAISSSCILAGARTLTGALTPLKGIAPTNFNFVANDYDRKNGLTGDGATKYLDSGVDENDFPQNDFHLSVKRSATTGDNQMFIGGNVSQNSTALHRNRTNTSAAYNGTYLNSFFGTSRSSADGFYYWGDGSAVYFAVASSAPPAESIYVFCRNASSPNAFTTDTIKFYSIGTNIDLTLLNARIAILSTDINNAF